MTIRLIIDDLRTHREGGVHCRTSESGIDHLRHPKFRVDETWLDHDLGGDDTIMPVVDYLCERAHNGDPVKVGVVYVHSSNSVGAANVMRALERYGYEVKRRTTDNFTA